MVEASGTAADVDAYYKAGAHLVVAESMSKVTGDVNKGGNGDDHNVELAKFVKDFSTQMAANALLTAPPDRSVRSVTIPWAFSSLAFERIANRFNADAAQVLLALSILLPGIASFPIASSIHFTLFLRKSFTFKIINIFLHS